MGNGRQTILDRLRKTFRIDYDDDCLDKWEGMKPGWQVNHLWRMSAVI